MDKCPQFKGYYMVIDNSPIHGKNGKLNQLIESRGYKCVYLPPYFPELKTRIAEACNQVPRNYFHSIAKHSVRVSEDCLNELLI